MSARMTKVRIFGKWLVTGWATWDRWQFWGHSMPWENRDFIRVLTTILRPANARKCLRFRTDFLPKTQFWTDLECKIKCFWIILVRWRLIVANYPSRVYLIVGRLTDLIVVVSNVYLYPSTTYTIYRIYLECSDLKFTMYDLGGWNWTSLEISSYHNVSG